MDVIESVIFDMDGVLIDSEPFWCQAEIEVLGSNGIKLDTTLCQKTMGLRIDEAVDFWIREFGRDDLDKDQVSTQINEKVIELIKVEGKPMVGSLDFLAFLKDRGIPCVLASSSSSSIIEAVLDALGISSYFKKTFSAEHLTHGKPHPAVFLKALEFLGSSPERTLIVEDSIFGSIAARAAKCKLLAVPDAQGIDHKDFAIADLKMERLDCGKIQHHFEFKN